MSDYSGPSEKVHVMFMRDWRGIQAGHVSTARWYPELGTYYVDAAQQSIGNHPLHEGLIERVTVELADEACG
jgi:hypothetical protein